jgi:outer membrane protein assembly factor BamB
MNKTNHVILLFGTVIGLAACGRPLMGDDWPQWRGPTRDGVWRETGIRERFSGPQLPLRWGVPIGSGYSGPTVAEGRAYVTDRQTDPRQTERVLCFDWQTGRSLWSFTYDCDYNNVSYTAGPRASVSIDDGRAYALGTMGHLHCLDAASGKVLWKKEPGVDYKIRVPMWGIAAAPLVDGDRVIVQLGAEGVCLVAMDKRTGVERWRALDDRASYSAPIIIRQAGRRVLVGTLSPQGFHEISRVKLIEPTTGQLDQRGGVCWSHPAYAYRHVFARNDRRLVCASLAAEDRPSNQP